MTTDKYTIAPSLLFPDRFAVLLEGGFTVATYHSEQRAEEVAEYLTNQAEDDAFANPDAATAEAIHREFVRVFDGVKEA